MPNVSGEAFGALNRDFGRMLGGMRSSGDTSSMLSVSTIPPTSQSSLGGGAHVGAGANANANVNVNAVGSGGAGAAGITGITSPNLNPAARAADAGAGGAGTLPAPADGAEDAAGGGQINDMLATLRKEEEEAARRAEEREERRKQAAAEAAARKEKLLAEQKARREARKAELSAVLEQEFTLPDDAGGAGAVAPSGAAGQPPVASTGAAPDTSVDITHNTAAAGHITGITANTSRTTAGDWELSPDVDASGQSGAGVRRGSGAAPHAPPATVVNNVTNAATRAVPAGAMQRDGFAGGLGATAVYKACKKCSEWQAKCGVLEDQIAREREQNAVERQQAAEAARAEVLKVEHKLEEQEHRADQLATQNEVLNARFEGRNIRLDIKKQDIEMVSVDDMKLVREEIMQQEALIAQYQTEDEKHTHEIRGLRQQVTELQKQVLKHEQAQRAAKDASNTSITQDSTTKVVRDLSKENERLKETLRIKEEEAELEKRRLVTGRAALEKKLAQVDWQKAEDDGLAIRDLKLRLEKQAQAHEEAVRELQEKLEWYIANQDILTKHDALVDRQTTEIEALKTRLVEVDSRKSVRGGVVGVAVRGGGGKGLDQRKYIGELQAKIKGLEEIIKAKHPNSIPELIRACKPTETEVDMYRTMQERIQYLNQELTDREGEYEKGIRQLRQEADRTVLEYQTRYNALKEELKVKVKSATSAKVKELERKVDDTRAYYLKKVKDLETQVLEYRKTSKAAKEKKAAGHPRATTAVQTEESGDAHAAAAAASPPPAMPAHAWPHAPPGYGMGMPAAAYAMPLPHTGYGEMMYCASEVSRMRSEIEALRREGSRAASAPTAHDARSNSNSAGGGSTAPGGADDLRRDVRRLTADLAAARADAAAAATSADALRSQLQLLQSRKEEEGQAAAARHEEQVRALGARYDAEIERLKNIVDSNQAAVQLAALKKGDRLEYLSAVRRKLQSVEQEYALREAELRRAVEEGKRLAAFELDLQKQKMNLLLQAKNNELDKFRVQLDALLDEMDVLRQQQQQPIAAP